MSFPTYQRYKDSGVGWLGEVPEHWITCALNYRYEIALGKMLDEKRITGNHLAPYLRNTDVQWGKINTDDLPLMDFSGADLERFSLQSGDLLVCEGGEVGRAAIWREELSECYYQKALHRVRPRDCQSDSPVFLFYLIHAATQLGLFAASAGKATINHLPAEAFRRYVFAFPTPSEQSAIAAFLDHETAKIDALVEEQRRLIELLKEKHQAVISHAVTKGLNPNAPVKDSGIEWLGEVPTHWDILPLRRVVQKFVDYRGATPTKVDDGVPLITATQIKNGRIDHSLDPVYISEEEYAVRMTRGYPAQGDLLLTTEAPLGECALVEEERVAPGQRIILMKMVKDRMTSEYLHAHFHSQFGQSELWTRASGSTASGIRADRLRASNVLVPPLEEQHAIAEHIRDMIGAFEDVFSVAEANIALLQERRTALISAVVTGKIDVRGLVRQTSELELA